LSVVLTPGNINDTAVMVEALERIRVPARHRQDRHSQPARTVPAGPGPDPSG
jgi:hypothetical protein